MDVSASDREWMHRVAAQFGEAETDDKPDEETRRARIADANRWRLAHGIAPLREEDQVDPPELELYRRARALGLGDSRS
jgi:hypothetical protein